MKKITEEECYGDVVIEHCYMRQLWKWGASYTPPPLQTEIFNSCAVLEFLNNL